MGQTSENGGGTARGRSQVEYLAGLPTAEVLRRVGALSKDTIVFTPGYFVDGAGEVSTPRQSVERIAGASAVPVYGAFDTLLGAGIVGGYMTPYEAQAREAGSIVVRLLNGTAPRISVLRRSPGPRWSTGANCAAGESTRAVASRYGGPVSRTDRMGQLLARDLRRHRDPGASSRIDCDSLLLERRSKRHIAAALEESQRRMNLAAGAARLSLWVWDAARDRIWATTYLRARAGLPETPIAFEEVLAKVHPADREQLDHAVKNALATGEELDVEYRITEQDGAVRWIAARGQVEKGNGGHLFGVAVDITEHKLAELRAVEDRAALRHMTRVSMLGQLSASIAHQLNQPLAAILGNAEAARKMLNRDRVDLVELREICDDIVTEDNRAAEVIRRLGALYKRGDMKMEPLDLNELIDETLELLRAELLTRHVVPQPT